MAAIFLRLAEAADMAEVGLGDVDRPGAEQLVELAPVDQPLAGSDRHRRLGLDRDQPQGLAGRQRLLDEQRPERGSASMYCSAAEAEPQRPWKSTMISTSSPTAARIAPMQRATLSIWRGLAV